MVVSQQNRQPLFLLVLRQVALRMLCLLVGFFYDLLHSIFLSLDLFVRFGQCSVQELSNSISSDSTQIGMFSYCRFFSLQVTSRIKTVLAGELDCPQDNQALQASTELRFETKLSIVFIRCCEIVPPA